MKDLVQLGRLTAILIAASFCMAQAALADDAAKAPSVVDVKLQQGGILLGQVVTPENAAVAEQPVTLRSREKDLAMGATDKSGYFAFSGLQNGVYQVTTVDGQGTFRVWTAQTAPPAAQPGALIVSGDEAVRGQGVMRGVRNALGNPLVAGSLITAGIVIPIALDDDDDPSTP